MEEALKQFTNLCGQMGSMIEAANKRMDALERQIELLRMRQKATYNQTEVAQMTGWSVSLINKLVTDGEIKTVPGTGRAQRIPSSEVDRIVMLKGYGPKHRNNN